MGKKSKSRSSSQNRSKSRSSSKKGRPSLVLDPLENFGDGYTGLRHMTHATTAKPMKKKAKPGARPRPKDRQQIQDRLSELRELIPKGEKKKKNLWSRSRWNMLSRNSVSWKSMGHGGKRVRFGRVNVATDDSASSTSFADDYYSVLGLLPDATPEQIKKAYYNCMKSCHPDLSGNDPGTTNFCMFINEVYAVLSDPVQRMVYDEIHGYALTAINPFLDDTYPKDHVFVDEFSCIGCKNCASVAPEVFSIEEDFGRARARSQSGIPDLVQQAIDSCPVDCIHWTSAAQLSLLEDEMRRVERVNVALMLSGMGSSVDVFRMASSRWEKRQIKVLEQARARMMNQKGSDKTGTNWGNLWGNAKNYESKEEEVKERAKRAAAAAAARRWREYSRTDADKPSTFKLPEAISNKEK